jgi:phosphate transport system permease protein
VEAGTPAGFHGFNLGDRIFKGLTFASAAGIILVLILLVGYLTAEAWASIQRFGFTFLTTTDWDPVKEKFGSLHLIYGTLVTSLIALTIAGPIGVGAALYLAEYAPGWVRTPVSFIIEMLAVIPSIIFGLWAFFLLAPFMRANVEPFLKGTVGQVPVIGALFTGQAIGKDYLVAGVILAIMILPTVTAISREIFLTVPDTQREGMLALGGTKWETIRFAVLPYARAGVIGALMLGFGRAFGETMAVTMVIGNSSKSINASLFTPGYTMASAIANQFTEADKEIYFAALVEIAVVLLGVAALVNLGARFIISRLASGPAGSRT